MDRKKTAPTIKDIARKAGVSIATVSRAINQEEGLSSATRERVLGISRQLHYYPNLQARGLVACKPEAVGIVIPQSSKFALSNPFYNEVLKGIGSQDQRAGTVSGSFLSTARKLRPDVPFPPGRRSDRFGESDRRSGDRRGEEEPGPPRLDPRRPSEKRYRQRGRGSLRRSPPSQ